ncbi:DUF3307 domain-containing protein [Pararhizobium mangrovi]|uniref:DUF3307 domain-containing protein n=1 Tax=Pararhizobium mangrovi TaxID=2590452 RepID=A0A506TWQ3_9HYPH|nr:DUF3307 domain-containing protein [Pararhizobium mangrovi]TPW26472.1 DUF3307 domain-containing protein [Pararhizobium mangrovi]
MHIAVVLVLIGLQVKHFAADYLLQPKWMLANKTNLAHPGGYLHALVHVAGSLIVLVLYGVAAVPMTLILVAEGLVHFAIDYSQTRWAERHAGASNTWTFWAAHGTDQFLHQLTYVAVVYMAALFQFG